MNNVSRYWKAILAWSGAVGVFVAALATDDTFQGAISDDRITSGEWYAVIVSIVTAISVTAKGNYTSAGTNLSDRVDDKR